MRKISLKSEFSIREINWYLWNNYSVARDLSVHHREFCFASRIILILQLPLRKFHRENRAERKKLFRRKIVAWSIGRQHNTTIYIYIYFFFIFLPIAFFPDLTSTFLNIFGANVKRDRKEDNALSYAYIYCINLIDAHGSVFVYRLIACIAIYYNVISLLHACLWKKKRTLHICISPNISQYCRGM